MRSGLVRGALTVSWRACLHLVLIEPIAVLFHSPMCMTY